MKQLKGKYLMVLIAVCGIAAASMGMLTNVSGLFFTPISEELGVGRGSVSLTLTISNLIFAVGGILSARELRGPNFKKVLIIGAAVFAGCTALLAVSSSLILLYLFNAIRGFAAGVVGNVAVSMIITNWFHSNTGLLTSIAMGCSGIAGALFTPILSAVIEKAGWRTAYVVDGIIIAVMYLPAILFPIAFRPDDIDMEPMGYQGERQMQEVAQSNGASISRVILILAFAYAALVAFISSFPPHMSSVATSFGFSEAVGAGMLSACLVANTAGKIIFGAAADRIGAKRTILIYCTIFLAASLLLLLVHVSGLMIPFAVMFGVVYTLPTVSLVLLCRDAFGQEHYAATYPKVTMIMTVVNAFGTSIIGYIYDLTGGYEVSLIICAVVAVLSMTTAIIIYRKK